MMTLAVVLAVLTVTELVTVPMILVLALLLGCANAVDMPVRQSFAIEMVGREDIGNAVALNSAMFNGARVVGPAIAGLDHRRWSASAAAFAINAVSFLAVIIGLLAMRDVGAAHPAPHRSAAVGQRGLRTPRGGLDYVRSTPLVLLAVLVVGLVATVRHELRRRHPDARARTTLDSDAAGYGFLMAASGVGSLLRRALARLPRTSRGRSGSPPARSILGIGEVAPGRVESFPLSLAAHGRRRVRGHRHGGDGQYHASSSPRPTRCAAA